MKDTTRRVHIVLMLVCILLILTTGIVLAKPTFRLVYVVQEGDNLSIIAKKFETSVTLLKKVNDFSDRSVLLAGDELYIPLPGEIADDDGDIFDTQLFSDPASELRLLEEQEYIVRIKADPVKVNIPKDQIITYHVKRGDNLYSLAREFGTTVAIIKALNKMDTNNVRIGQQIAMPAIGFTAKQILSKTISADELNLLARAVHAEARGESYLGKVAVAAVILNRVINKYFPNTIEGVVFQRGQFESVSNGQINLHPTSSAFKAAREALSGVDPSRGALYFINPRYTNNTAWFDRRQKTVTIGQHVFAK